MSRLKDEHVRRQVAARALLKLADGGQHSRHDLFYDRRLTWSGKSATPHWQQRLLMHLRDQGLVERTGENNGTRYEVCPGGQQALRQLRADPQGLCAILFSDEPPVPGAARAPRKFTSEAVSRAREIMTASEGAAPLRSVHSRLRETQEVLQAELGLQVSIAGIFKALQRTNGAAADAELLERAEAPGSVPTEDDEDEPGEAEKLDALLRIAGATAEAVMSMQQRLTQLEASVQALHGPVTESAAVLQQLK